MDKKLIGAYLLEQKLVTRDQLEKALEMQANQIDGGHMPLIGTVLLEMGVLNEQDLAFALAQQERDRMRVLA
jgi:hypothetical protein